MANRNRTLSIDAQRLRADLAAVNRMGTLENRPGINRISFSDVHMEGRHWLIGRLQAAGLAEAIADFALADSVNAEPV